MTEDSDGTEDSDVTEDSDMTRLHDASGSRAGAAPKTYRAVLRLLDHQVVGPDGELLGNVDDLELVVSDEGWFVTALQVGPAAWGQRLPGRLGRWTVAIWRRLQTSEDPRTALVPISELREIGSALTISRPAAFTLAGSFGLELWLRKYVVSRIPGAKGGGDDRDSVRDIPLNPRLGRSVQWTLPRGVVRTGSVARVIRARVFADDGTELGVVSELLCAEPAGGRPRDHLRVTHVEYGLHEAGSELGYNSDSGQGPLVVGALVRWWQRANRVAPIDDVVDIDLGASTVRVRSHARHVHPHLL